MSHDQVKQEGPERVNAQEFLSLVIVKDNDCWEWAGYVHKSGYGQTPFSLGGERYAHRVSYMLFIGPIPGDVVIRHKCNNPPCVNPRHLLTGTMADNYQDAVRAGRAPMGERNGCSKLKVDQVLMARSLHAQGFKRAFISKQTGIPPREVWAIVTRRRWKHVQ